MTECKFISQDCSSRHYILFRDIAQINWHSLLKSVKLNRFNFRWIYFLNWNNNFVRHITPHNVIVSKIVAIKLCTKIKMDLSENVIDLDANCRLRHGLNADCSANIFIHLNVSTLMDLAEMSVYYKQIIHDFVLN